MRHAWMAAGLFGMTAASLAPGRTAVATRGGEAPLSAATGSGSVTVPFAVDHNRVIVEIELLRPDGTARRASAWVDTGNERLVVTEPLARDLGFDAAPPVGTSARPAAPATMPTPHLRIGGLALDTEGISTRVNGAASRVIPGVPAEVQLPAGALRHHQVVFDYPAGRLTIAPPGAIEHRGVAIPCRVNAVTGLFQVTATVDGDTVQLGVDTGSAGTWVSDRLASVWRSRHPDWPRATGALGSANFFGFDFEAGGWLMRLPELRIGDLRVRDVPVLGLDPGLFDWYSKKSAGQVAGFVGANVLTGFRLEIDFTRGMTYWEAGPLPDSDDLDIVGLVLRPEPDGSYAIAGVASRDSVPTVGGVQAGDRLTRVDTLDTRGRTMGEVTRALRGKPGTSRTLVIERDGKPITLAAKVTRFP